MYDVRVLWSYKFYKTCSVDSKKKKLPKNKNLSFGNKYKNDKNFPNYSVLTGRRKKTGYSYRIMDLITNSNLIMDLITNSNSRCYK